MGATVVSKVGCLRWLTKVIKKVLEFIFIFLVSNKIIRKNFSFTVVTLILSDGQVRFIAWVAFWGSLVGVIIETSPKCFLSVYCNTFTCAWVSEIKDNIILIIDFFLIIDF